MLRWAIIFLIVALVAALLGVGGLATGATAMATILFYVFIGVTALLFVVALVSGGKTSVP